MIKDDTDLSIAIDILDRKIANLNMAIVNNPNNLKLKEELEEVLKVKEKISKGNVELIKRIVNDTKK